MKSIAAVLALALAVSGTAFAPGTPDLKVGGRCNPATDMWTPMSTLNQATQGVWHTAVRTGTQLLVWGGYSRSAYLRDGCNPSDNCPSDASADQLDGDACQTP